MRRIVFTLVALVVLGGCAGAGTSINNPLELAPTGRYDRVAVVYAKNTFLGAGGNVYLDGTREWFEYHNRLTEALRGSDAFVEVLDLRWASLTDSALRVSAYLVGRTTGACVFWCEPIRHYIGNTVRLLDTGLVVAEFTIWKEYSGDSPSDSLIGSLADETAAAIVRWTRREALSR